MTGRRLVISSRVRLELDFIVEVVVALRLVSLLSQTVHPQRQFVEVFVIPCSFEGFDELRITKDQSQEQAYSKANTKPVVDAEESVRQSISQTVSLFGFVLQ
jgi:hypothetical protein